MGPALCGAVCVFYVRGNCASIVVEIKKNCEAILVIVAAGRQFFVEE